MILKNLITFFMLVGLACWAAADSVDANLPDHHEDLVPPPPPPLPLSLTTPGHPVPAPTGLIPGSGGASLSLVNPGKKPVARPSGRREYLTSEVLLALAMLVLVQETAFAFPVHIGLPYMSATTMNTRFTRIALTLRIMRITPVTNAKVILLIIIGGVVVSFLIMKIGMWLSAMINASGISSLDRLVWTSFFITKMIIAMCIFFPWSRRLCWPFGYWLRAT